MRLVQNSSARIDGVGFQGHFSAGGTPSAAALAGVFARFVALGVEVAVTELDVRLTLPANASAVAQQAQDYMAVVGACLDTPRCVGIVVWQFTDKYSWVPSTFAGTGEACLYDAQMARKPVWTSVSAQLAAAAATARPGTATGMGMATGATVRPTGTGGVGAGVAAPTGALSAMPTSLANGTVQVAGSVRLGARLGAVLLAAVSGGLVMFA